MESNGIFWNSSMLHCIPIACIEWTGFQRIRSMESWNPLEDSIDFHEIRGRPWTHGAHGVPWIPRNSMEGKIFHGSYWVPWNSMVSTGFHRIHGVPWIRSNFIDARNIHRLFGVPWKFMDSKEHYGFNGNPWNPYNSNGSMEFLGSSWSSTVSKELHGIHLVAYWLHGSPWNPWDSMGATEFMKSI